MMTHGSLIRETGRGNRTAVADARAKAMRSASPLAMGQALRRGVLPCAVVMAALLFPKDELRAVQVPFPFAASVENARDLLISEKNRLCRPGCS